MVDDSDIIFIDGQTNPDKLIFLDIDGVLNKNVNTVIYKSMVLRLQKIVQETGAKVVLSSSWRTLKNYAIPLCIELSKFGIEIIDFTPNHGVWGRGHRGKEIESWLLSNTKPNEVSFVILDDDIDVNETYPNNVVNTHPLNGLDDEDVIKAIAILNRKS